MVTKDIGLLKGSSRRPTSSSASSTASHPQPAVSDAPRPRTVKRLQLADWEVGPLSWRAGFLDDLKFDRTPSTTRRRALYPYPPRPTSPSRTRRRLEQRRRPLRVGQPMVMYTPSPRSSSPRWPSSRSRGQLAVANQARRRDGELGVVQGRSTHAGQFDAAMADKPRSRRTPTRRSGGWTRRTSSSAASAASTRWTAQSQAFADETAADGRRRARVRLHGVRGLFNVSARALASASTRTARGVPLRWAWRDGSWSTRHGGRLGVRAATTSSPCRTASW